MIDTQTPQQHRRRSTEERKEAKQRMNLNIFSRLTAATLFPSASRLLLLLHLPKHKSSSVSPLRPHPSPLLWFLSSRRMDLPHSDPVADDFVHVPEPVVYSVFDGEGAPTAPAEPRSPLGSPPSVECHDEGLEEGSEERGEGDGRAVLPEELVKSVVHLECESSQGGVCDVCVVGTAHVSQESCREVQAVISRLKPEVVFLELCASRIAILQPPQSLQHVPTIGEMMDMWKKKNMNALGILYSWFLAKIANQLEILPGSEFRVAFEEAMSYGAKVILGDRPVQITLRRTWGKMSLWHKAKFVYCILFQAVFLPSSEDLNKLLKEFDDADMVTLLVQEMSKQFPSLMETLVYERDLYMSSKLLKVASDHNSVVAVVGKGHLAGIKKHWKQPIELEHVLEIPPSSSLPMLKLLASLTVAAAGAAIVSGIYLCRKK